MPKVDPYVPTCGNQATECIAKVSKYVSAKNFSCDCLPGCFALSYSQKVSISPLNLKAEVFKDKHLNGENMTILHVYYDDYYFRSQNIEEFVDFSDFLGLKNY